MKQNGFYLDLSTPENKERNNIVSDIVAKYEKKARMGEATLILYCIDMFCAGVKYQQEVINAELKFECSSKVIGNTFITSMNEAVKEADIVAFSSDLPLLLECGKDCFNNGIHYANTKFHDAVNEICEMEISLL